MIHDRRNVESGDIDIKVDLKKREPLNYELGVQLYVNYVRHFVTNRLPEQQIRLLFYCEGSGKIPLGFIAGIIDGMEKDKICLENMIFKVNSADVDIRSGYKGML